MKTDNQILINLEKLKIMQSLKLNFQIFNKFITLFSYLAFTSMYIC